jgi:hypothetical protein
MATAADLDPKDSTRNYRVPPGFFTSGLSEVAASRPRSS